MNMRTIVMIILTATLLLAFQNCGSRSMTLKPMLILKPSEGTSSGNPSGPDVTFKVVNAQVFLPSCVKCHSGTNSDSEDSVRYDGYQNVINYGKLDSLESYFSSHKSPGSACTTISDENMDLVSRWIHLGAPQ